MTLPASSCIGGYIVCYTTTYDDAKSEKTPANPLNVDMTSVIADVPVKIAVMLGDEMLGEFEHVVQLAFDPATAAGKSHSKDFSNLTARGIITTETALFTIAIGEFHKHAVETFVKLATAEVINRAAGHSIRMPMKQNGDITYRIPVKA